MISYFSLKHRFKLQQEPRPLGSLAPNAPSWSDLSESDPIPHLINIEHLTDFTDFPSKSKDLEPILLDSHNADLLDNVRPTRWIDPEYEGEYDMVVIGGGAGGLITALRTVMYGGKAALIERNLMGGDCLNSGCVPSKAFLKSAKVVSEMRKGREYGIEVNGEIQVNFDKVMERMRRIRAQISHHDSCRRFSDTFGVSIYLGDAQFVSNHQVKVNDKVLGFNKCTIATGAKPRIPHIPGLNSVPYYTNENIWNLTYLPHRIIFLGSGPVSCELSQCFARFGSECVIITMGDRILSREDQDASDLLEQTLLEDNIKILRNTTILSINPPKFSENSRFPLITCKLSDGFELQCECLFIAIGRAPNISSLNLSAANIQTKEGKLVLNEYLSTTNPDIYAVGDCTHYRHFTHLSDAHARLVVDHAFFNVIKSADSLIVPSCTYTDPEIAHIGKYEHELISQNIPYRKFVKYFKDNGRAICEDAKKGYVKILCKVLSDEILGATIVGNNAGDLISSIGICMMNNLGLSNINSVIYPYPTYGESIKYCADSATRTSISELGKNVMMNLRSN
jgi:pyruvate/2-oxoglutarate dehydrogenase complex dihydrolipoamide dehydrogenase (E3) component